MRNEGQEMQNASYTEEGGQGELQRDKKKR